MVRLGELVMILDLAREGLLVSAIARRTGLDCKTIRKYIARGLEAPVYTPRSARPTLLTPFEPCLLERLQAFPDLSARRPLRELKERGYTGGYTILKAAVGAIRAACRRHRYTAAKAKIIPGVELRQNLYLNNRAENSHQQTRLRERRMKRFKSPRRAQQLLSAHSPIHQHCHSPRHLITASEYWAHRAEDFVLWQQETCARQVA